MIVTSQTTLEWITPPFDITVIAVGKKTASKVRAAQVWVAEEECAEGVVELLKKVDPKDASILYPHSAKSRPVIEEHLRNLGYKYLSVPLYDVIYQAVEPLPDLTQFDKVVFTSPSTVDGFFAAFSQIRKNLHLECIGKVTQAHLTKKFLQEII